MLKSNNNHCQPDIVGEQKGEQSPFCHIGEKNALVGLSVKKGIDPSFWSESDFEDFSIFFHTEARSAFLTSANEELAKRLDTEYKLRTICDDLSKAFAESVFLFSHHPKETSLSAECAGIALRVSKFLQKISTNFIFSIIHYSDIVSHDDTFFHIKKKLILCEIAMEESGDLPPDWEQTKERLLQIPPSETIGKLSRVLGIYRETDDFLSSVLTDAAKAAKKDDAAKYNRLLEIAALRLHDAAALLKF